MGRRIEEDGLVQPAGERDGLDRDDPRMRAPSRLRRCGHGSPDRRRRPCPAGGREGRSRPRRPPHAGAIAAQAMRAWVAGSKKTALSSRRARGTVSTATPPACGRHRGSGDAGMGRRIEEDGLVQPAGERDGLDRDAPRMRAPSRLRRCGHGSPDRRRRPCPAGRPGGLFRPRVSWRPGLCARPPLCRPGG